MARTFGGSLLIAAMLVVLGATASEACHWRRAYQPAPPAPCGCDQAGYTYAAPTGQYGAETAYAPTSGGYYGGGTAAPAGGYPAASGYGTTGYPGGYGYGQPGYNPGGLGGPMSGLGVRPGLGFGGLGRGR